MNRFDESTKLQIINELLVTKQMGHKLEISLRFKAIKDKENIDRDKIKQANDVMEKTDELRDKIDDLHRQVMDEWIGQSKEINADIIKTNSSLEATINDIQKDLKTAENVIKAIGYIDEAVAIASKIASKML